MAFGSLHRTYTAIVLFEPPSNAPGEVVIASIMQMMGFSPGVQLVKNPPAMQKTQEMQFRSLGQEDPLEEKIATYSSILAWRIPTG